MAGRRVYRSSDVATLLHKGIAPHAFDTLISSASAGFDGSGCMLNFEEACGSVTDRQFYRPLSAEETGDGDELDVCFHQPEKKRRLTADKVQFLEKSFETENKLEPERKVQLAKDLGLQPKQVAIWFQNRRARWKTKQLEKDYEALKSGYNALKMDYESLQKEKEKLQAEVIFLTNKLLLKEKKRGKTEAAQSKNLEHDSVIEANGSETPVMGVKQEVLSSTNSTISDSESPHCTDRGQNPLLEPAVSSNAFDPDHSGLSHDDEDEEVKGAYHQFLKLEDDSNYFPFPVEDQALWFWPSY